MPTNKTENPTPSTPVNAFLEDLSGGKFHRKLGVILSEVAKAVIDADTAKQAKGKVTLSFDLVRVGETAQLVIGHDIKYDRPTLTGRRIENSNDATYMYTDINGNISLTQPDNYMLIGANSDTVPGLELTPELLYKQAVDIVKDTQRASISYLQRKLGIGFTRASEIIDRMEADKIISEPLANGSREVYS